MVSAATMPPPTGASLPPFLAPVFGFPPNFPPASAVERAANLFQTTTKPWNDFRAGPYPANGPWYKQGAWLGDKAFGDVGNLLDRRGMVQDGAHFLKWGLGRLKHASRSFAKDHPRIRKEFRNRYPHVRKVFKDDIHWNAIKRLAHWNDLKHFAHSNFLTRFLKANPGVGRFLTYGGKVLDNATTVFDAVTGPAAIYDDIKSLRDNVAKRRFWGSAKDAGWLGYDTWSTAKAWQQSSRWLANGARWGSRFLTEEALPVAGDVLAGLGENVLLPAAEVVGAFFAGDAALAVGALALAAAGLYGGYYAVTHPEQTKEFAYDVLVDVFGSPQLQAQSGSHPIADATALGLRFAKDTIGLNPSGLWNDAGDALDLILGKHAPGQAEHPLKQDWWQLGKDALKSLFAPSARPSKPTPGRDWLQGLMNRFIGDPRHPIVNPAGPVGLKLPAGLDTLRESPRLNYPQARAPKMPPPLTRGLPSVAASNLASTRRPPSPLLRAASAPRRGGWPNGPGPARNSAIPNLGIPNPGIPSARMGGGAVPTPARHAPLSLARRGGRVHAPQAIRSPQTRHSSASPAASRTQAEIRVRFDDMPSAPSTARAGGYAPEFETGAQFSH